MNEIKSLIETTLTSLDITHYPMRASQGGYLEFDEAMTLPCCLVEEDVRIVPISDSNAFSVSLMFYLLDEFGDDKDSIWDTQNVLFAKAIEIVKALRENNKSLSITAPTEYIYQHEKTAYLDCGVSFEITFTFNQC